MEIQRKVEMAIAGYLTTALPGRKFVASEEDEGIEPPYGVVAVDDDQSTLADDVAEMLVVDVIWCTHMDDTPAADHSEAAKLIRDALLELPRGSNGFYPEQKLRIHGADVMTAERVSAGKARGSAVTLMVGASDQE